MERHYRKIQITGGRTHTISLPKNWAEKLGLKKGTQLEIVENDDGTLLILPEHRKASQTNTATYNIQKMGANLIPQATITLYLKGCEKIRFKNISEPGQKVKLRETIGKLPGTEIVKDEKHEMTVVCLLDEKSVNIPTLLDRMFSLTTEMLHQVTELSTPPKPNQLRNLDDLEDETDKFHFLCLRLLCRIITKKDLWRENGITDYGDIISLVQIVRALERIGDHIHRLSPYTNTIEKLRFRGLIEILQNTREAMIRKNPVRAEQIIASITKLKQKPGEMKSGIVSESYSRILSYISDINEMTINMSLHPAENKHGNQSNQLLVSQL